MATMTSPALPEQLNSMRSLASAAPRATFQERLRAFEALSDAMLARHASLGPLTGLPGFAFLAGFLRASHLEALLGREIRVAALDAFVALGGRHSLRLVPRGVACHWVAGNVPMLGVLSWVVSALVGNVNVVRLSSRSEDAIGPAVDCLRTLSTVGSIIAEETLVLRFDRDDEAAHRAMSAVADVRVAWGGQEAVEALLALPASWDCETVVLGPRVSVAVVDPPQLAGRALERLVTDIVYFDQLACSSPQTVFVKGTPGEAGFDAFVERFIACFADRARGVPRHRLDFGETYRIALDRARLALGGGVVARDAGTSWTVALVPAPDVRVRCANRFVQVVPFTNVAALGPHVPRNVQTAVIALDESDTASFTELGARRGVCRFPRPGQGNNFETPWDGLPLASRLTRWVVRSDGGA